MTVPSAAFYRAPSGPSLKNLMAWVPPFDDGGTTIGDVGRTTGRARTDGSLDDASASKGEPGERASRCRRWRAEREIGRRSGVDPDAVRGWRRRFVEEGIEGVGAIAKGPAESPS
jgi:hypothetical protein